MRCLRLLLCLLATTAGHAATFVWSGAAGDGEYDTPANWVGGVVPPNDHTATLIFGNQGAGTVHLPFFSQLQLSQIQFQNTAGQSYTFQGLALVDIQNGFGSSAGGSARFMSGVGVNLMGASQTVTVANGSLELSGPVLGGASLIKQGAGNLLLSGINLYSGGTRVENGSLTFGSANAIPVSGGIETSSTGYIGVTFNSGVQNAFLNRIDTAHYTGVVGFDTAASQSSPTVFSETIDLRTLGSIAGVGTQTSARITGELKIASGQNYRFTGTGTLYLESNLGSSSSKLVASSTFGTPLTLVLRGLNSFTGGIDILNSVVILDGNKTIMPASGTAPNSLIRLQGPGYIGATENLLGGPGGFLNRVGTISSSDAIVGFDAAVAGQTRVVNDAIDLSVGGTRLDPYYLGTSTRLTLNGQITPTVGDALHLTAIKDGWLKVNSNLGPGIPSLVIGQANPFTTPGTVELAGSNTFSGGTEVRGGVLRASSNAALGTGNVAVLDRATLSVASGVILPNSLNLSSGSTLTGTGGFSVPGGVTVGSGVFLSPGGTGTIGQLTFASGLTLNGGSIFHFDLGSTTGSPGLMWDLLSVSGGPLNIGSSPITLNLYTVTAAGVQGALVNFNNTQSYSWQFASATSVNGFSSGAFSFNTTSFSNDLGGGSFFVSQNPNGLSLNFTPVPEPGTYVLLALGLGFVAFVELRRRKS